MLNLGFEILYNDDTGQEFSTQAETKEEADIIAEDLEADGYNHVRVREIRR